MPTKDNIIKARIDAETQQMVDKLKHTYETDSAVIRAAIRLLHYEREQMEARTI